VSSKGKRILAVHKSSEWSAAWLANIRYPGQRRPLGQIFTQACYTDHTHNTPHSSQDCRMWRTHPRAIMSVAIRCGS